MGQFEWSTIGLDDWPNASHSRAGTSPQVDSHATLEQAEVSVHIA
jgi:hypothetical protein